MARRRAPVNAVVCWIVAFCLLCFLLNLNASATNQLLINQPTQSAAFSSMPVRDAVAVSEETPNIQPPVAEPKVEENPVPAPEPVASSPPPPPTSLEMPKPAVANVAESSACTSSRKGDVPTAQCQGFCNEKFKKFHCTWCKCRSCAFCANTAEAADDSKGSGGAAASSMVSNLTASGTPSAQEAATASVSGSSVSAISATEGAATALTLAAGSASSALASNVTEQVSASASAEMVSAIGGTDERLEAAANLETPTTPSAESILQQSGQGSTGQSTMSDGSIALNRTEQLAVESTLQVVSTSDGTSSSAASETPPVQAVDTTPSATDPSAATTPNELSDSADESGLEELDGSQKQAVDAYDTLQQSTLSEDRSTVAVSPGTAVEAMGGETTASVSMQDDLAKQPETQAVSEAAGAQLLDPQGAESGAASTGTDGLAEGKIEATSSVDSNVGLDLAMGADATGSTTVSDTSNAQSATTIASGNAELVTDSNPDAMSLTSDGESASVQEW